MKEKQTKTETLYELVVMFLLCVMYCEFIYELIEGMKNMGGY